MSNKEKVLGKNVLKLTKGLTSHNISQTWKELKNVLPKHTDIQRYLITLWWCDQIKRGPFVDAALSRKG